MTANKQVRAVLLAALMVFSVFAGSIAFTGTAAAAATSATVSSDTVDKGPSASVDVTVNSGGANDVHVWLDLNDDGYYNASEPNTTETAGSPATLSLSIPESVSTGEYNVSAAESASLTAGTTQQEAYDTLDVVAADPAGFNSATHYDDGTPKVEVAFDEDVTVNEMNVTDGETNLSQSLSVSNGQVIVTLSQVYTDDLEVTYNVSDSSGNTASATEDVTFAPVYVANNSNNTAYKGSNVAVVAGTTDTSVEVEGVDDDNNYQFSGSTGDNSQVFIFDTEDQALDTYEFTIGGVQQAQVDVRDLGFELTVDDLNVTTKDGLEGSVSANAGDRTVDVVALDDDGDEVEDTETTVTLDGQGEADFNLSSVDAGEYTIEATDAFTGVTLESDTVTVSKAKDSSGDFASSVINEQVGDIAEITVTLDGTDEAEIQVGANDLGYSANVSVEDGNDDGEVTLLFNTYAPNKTSSFDVDDSDDDLVVDDITTEIDGEPLDAGDYDLEIATGGEADNVATLVIEERSTESVSTWTAPTSADLTETEDVYDAIENENLTQSDSLANGDVVVTQISATGLEGAFDASNFDALSGTQFNLTIEQTNPGPNREAKVLGINSSSATIIADGDNDTYFIVYDLDDVSASRTDSYDNTSTLYTVEDDDAFNATFTVLEDGDLAEDDEETSDEFEVVEPELSLDEDEFAVSNAAEQSISGTASVAPGTELTIRVTSDGDTQPRFLKTASAYVQADGTFAAAFDFSEQNINDTFEVEASVDSGTAEDATADGIVGEATETTTAAETTTTEESTETATETEEPTEEPTETATATEEPTEEPTEETTESSTPGFGVVVALVALVAAALLAVRRD
ncbi:ArtA-dependent S-layer glycoprotein [Haloferax marisrubri]|uniref:PGF-CTERM sorting domain-containing protein n=2 Tax=Haloferax marisrubri TaxID=1544719 RepID=A0A2P4NWB2_9EURY|nr:ArtA-dependent S-layer glycoprotein [Haloferax marisrubri]POG57445.1 PGF-CTERM sorting domain-containing protein [Haloferax marisrubri]